MTMENDLVERLRAVLAEGLEPHPDEEKAALQARAGIPHPPTDFTYEARMAISGEGPRAFEWSDKKHRLVYDLCRAIESAHAGLLPYLASEAPSSGLTEEFKRAERVLDRADTSGDPLGATETWLIKNTLRKAEDRIQALEAELAAALIEVSNQARLRGGAEGKLHVSELAGIVEGWQLRAERAEAEVREAWNGAQCCDDTPLGQATLAEFIADQHKCRKSAEAELVRKTEALDKLLRAAVAVNRRGATTGYQWVDLGSVIVAARSALEEKTDV